MILSETWEASKNEKAKILVIDDDEEALAMVSLFLGKKEHEVILANGAHEGLKQAFQEKPDLIILDVLMPSLDGWAILTLLRSNEITKKTPVVMLTAADTIKNALTAIERGANAFITKPIDPYRLQKKIAQLINRSSS